MNNLTGEEYVGKTTKTLEERKKVHLKAMKTSKQFIHRAMTKHGVENFSWMILEEVKSDIDGREKYWIEALDTLSPNGYNLSRGGEGGDAWSVSGKVQTQEAKDKISKALSGRKYSEERKKQISLKQLGHKTSEETKKKISSSLKGTRFSKEHREKISLAIKKWHLSS